MSGSRQLTHERLVASAEGCLYLQALLVRHVGSRLLDLGPRGEAVLRRGLRRYGAWRGRRMRALHEARGLRPGPEALVAHWDAADLRLLPTLGRGTLRPLPGGAEVVVESTPEWDCWRPHGLARLARLYYEEVYAGVGEGYGAGIRAELDEGPALDRPWRVAWRQDATAGGPAGAGDGDAPSALGRSLFEEPLDEVVAVVRRTTQNYAALYAHVAREAVDAFDMMGEELLRRAVRAIGEERGRRMREAHLQAGMRLSLKTMMEHYDVPIDAAWEWRDEGLLTDGTWHRDCTYCPYFEVWQELGAVDLGYLYDYEFHMAQFRTYHPGIQVQFAGIKTRGDAMCRFRFSIPELQAEGEPRFEGRLA